MTIKTNTIETRRRKVHELNRKGMSNAAIAKRLAVSPRTIGRDMQAIKRSVSNGASNATNGSQTNDVWGWHVSRHGTKAISPRDARNPYFDMFDGIDTNNWLLNNTPQGLARGYQIAPIAYKCISVFGKTAGSIPFKVVNEDDEPLDKTAPLSKMLDGTRSRLIRDTVFDRRIFGVAYLIPMYSDQKRPRFRRLNPMTVKVIGNKNGIERFEQRIQGQVVATWKPNQVIFIPEYNPENDLGYLNSMDTETDVESFVSPLMLCLMMLKIDLSAWEYVRVFFENDATPSYVLTTEQQMQKADMDRVLDQYTKELEGVRNSHKPAIAHMGLKLQQLQSAMKDLVVPELDERNTRRICAILDVPMTIAGLTEAANYATAQEARKSFYTEGILPELDIILDEINAQFVSKIDPKVRYVADLDNVEVLQEDKTEVTDRASKGYISGFRSFNEARELDGIDTIDEKYDFVLIGGQPVLVADIAVGKLPKAPEPQQPQSPFGFNFGGGGYAGNAPSASAGMDLDRRLSDLVASVAGGKSVKSAVGDAYVVLSLANDPTLIEQTKQLKNLYPDLDYLPANDYHVTVLYLPNASQQVVGRIAGSLSEMPPMSLRVRRLGVFENDTNNLHFQIEPNKALLELQRNLYEFAISLGAETSPFSIPTNYKPHISIGYSSESLEIAHILPFEVKPIAMVLNVDDGNDEYEIIRAVKKMTQLALPEPVKNIVEVVVKTANQNADPEAAITDAVQSLVTKDLDKWCTKSTRKGTQTAFDSDYIPSALASFVKMDLRALHPKDGALEDQIKALFDTYKQAISAEPDDTLATPEEFEQYWQGVDDSFEDIIAIFDKHWQGLNAKIADAIRANGQEANLQAIVDENTESLIAELVGTDEDPAPLTKLFLAGAARGNDLFERSAQKSVKADATLTIDWKFVNKEAADWARNHAATMVRGINQTTLSAYQDAIAKWIEGTGDNGDGSMGNLAAAIEGQLSGLTIPSNWSPDKVRWATSPERAALIAQTESTNAFSRGVTERWKQVGVTKVKWRTQNDSRVCALCKRLNNVEGDITQGVFDQVTGEYYKPAAHGGCRCFEAPVV